MSDIPLSVKIIRRLKRRLKKPHSADTVQGYPENSSILPLFEYSPFSRDDNSELAATQAAGPDRTLLACGSVDRVVRLFLPSIRVGKNSRLHFV